MQSLKCVIVGDEEVGKSSLLNSYSAKKFPAMVREQQFQLELFDTSGKLRKF
jgi:GTPase SAR1 family protein